MAGISSLGVGSGIDVRGLVDQLLAAEREPEQNRLDSRESRLSAELSAFGSLKSALGDFRDAIAKANDASAFRSVKAKSGNSDAVAVSAGAEADTGRFDVKVDTLAQAQSVASGAFESETSNVGSGSLTFRFGTVSTDADGNVAGFSQNADRATVTIDIPSDASSLGDVRDAVNDADAGVRASIINDGSGERLVFSASDTGAGNGFVVDVADDDGDAADGTGLSQLGFNQTASNLILNRAGRDAQLKVDGLSVNRPSNEITDLVEGVTVTLRETTATAVGVEVSEDTAAARKLIDGFVKGYNDLQDQIDQLAGYDAEQQQGGVLQGDAVVRGVQSRVSRLATDTLSVLEGTGTRALADIGITSDANGRLTIDGDKLDAALSDNPEDVAALFGVSGQASGNGVRYVGSDAATEAGQYDVSVTQVAERAAVSGATIAAPTDGAPLTIDADNDTLALEIDGVSTGTLNLARGDYTSGEDLAAEMQARINGSDALQNEGVSVAVSFDSANDRFEITSTRYGSASSVELTAVDTNTASELGLSAGSTATGQDVQGTINGSATDGDGRSLTASDGAAAGLRLEIAGTQTGNLGQVTFSRGIAARLTDAIDGFIGGDGSLQAATDRLDRQIEDIGDDRADLQERLTRLEERYVQQFSAMDATVASLNQTSEFLSGQLSGLEQLASRSSGSDVGL